MNMKFIYTTQSCEKIDISDTSIKENNIEEVRELLAEKLQLDKNRINVIDNNDETFSIEYKQKTFLEQLYGR